MKSKINIYLILCFLITANSALARLHDYETTRLKSTAGAGVASVLLDESSIYNPASLAFFKTASIYYQQASGDQNHNFSDDPFETELKSKAIILSDAKRTFKGSVSYTDQQELKGSRKRVSVSTAKPIDKSSIGLMGRKTEENTLDSDGKYSDKEYYQAIIGIFHAVSSNATLAAIAIDPLGEVEEDRKLILGGQYLFQNYFSVIFDIGSDYKEDLSKDLLYKAAIQLKIFKDIYLRAGTFSDKGLQEKGNGFGGSWVGPRMILDFAFKNTKPISFSDNPISYNANVKETSFSLSYKF